MARNKLHGGLREIIRSGKAPMACTDETFCARRRGKNEQNLPGYHHEGLGQRVYGLRDLASKMAAQGAIQAPDSEGGYTL